MTIREAVESAKEISSWSVTFHEPTSVSVWYLDDRNQLHETELDLYEDDLITELEELWDSLYEEFNSAPDAIISVEAYGYIKD